jgi:hypothetical protein
MTPEQIGQLPIQLIVTVAQAQDILNFMGDLPSKSGVFPLMIQIKQQADEQVKAHLAPKPPEPPFLTEAANG